MKDDNYMQQVIYLIDTVVNNEALGPHGPPQSIPLPYEVRFSDGLSN
jgi:hypothetical protein